MTILNAEKLCIRVFKVAKEIKILSIDKLLSDNGSPEWHGDGKKTRLPVHLASIVSGDKIELFCYEVPLIALTFFFVNSILIDLRAIYVVILIFLK